MTPNDTVPTATKELEAVKEARVKILFALNDMVKNNLEEFWADIPGARSTQDQGKLGIDKENMQIIYVPDPD